MIAQETVYYPSRREFHSLLWPAFWLPTKALLPTNTTTLLWHMYLKLPLLYCHPSRREFHSLLWPKALLPTNNMYITLLWYMYLKLPLLYCYPSRREFHSLLWPAFWLPTKHYYLQILRIQLYYGTYILNYQ